MHRFAVTADSVDGDRVVFSKDQAHQMRSVLRLVPGQQVVAVVFGEVEMIVELTVIDRREAVGVVRERWVVDEGRGVYVVVAQAVLKAQKMDIVVQKATELGARMIIPVVCDRSVARPALDRQKRWQRIAWEAAEQCGRVTEPRVSMPVLFRDAVVSERCQLELMCDELEMERGLGDVTTDKEMERIKVFVGPEGGFTDREREMAREAGVIRVAMGPLVIRAETATVAALSMVMYRWGDLGRAVNQGIK